jgi:hypothetical protein
MAVLSTDRDSLFITMVLNAWNLQTKRVGEFLNKLSDQSLLKEVAPSRNRVYYLIGHLIAINDQMMPILGLGESKYPHLDELFVRKPDTPIMQGPTPEELRAHWKESVERLDKGFKGLSQDDWFNRHNSVSEQDFEREPHRNKLNIVVNRTNHMSYHLGQLMLVKD